MPSFPDDIYDPRIVENVGSVEYDPAKLSRFYAEDHNNATAEIVAIEEALQPMLPFEQNNQTPTYTNISNVGSFDYTPDIKYQRIGSYIYVFGYVQLTPDADLTQTLFSIDLPYASDLGNPYELCGVINSNNSLYSSSGIIYGDASTNVAVCEFTTTVKEKTDFTFNFMYPIYPFS